MKRNSCATLIKQIHNELEKNTNNLLRPQELTAAQSTAAGIVNRLEQRGYIGGFGDEADKRVKLLL